MAKSSGIFDQVFAERAHTVRCSIYTAVVFLICQCFMIVVIPDQMLSLNVAEQNKEIIE